MHRKIKKIRYYDYNNKHYYKIMFNVKSSDKRYNFKCNILTYKYKKLLNKNVNRKLKFYKKYFNHKQYQARFSIAKNSNCPIFILEKLINDKNHYVVSGVLSNPNCPVKFLEKYYNSSDFRLTSAIARNTSCPIYILNILLDNEKNEYGYVINNIIKNKKTSLDILKRIYKNYKSLRKKVIEHPNWRLTEFE